MGGRRIDVSVNFGFLTSLRLSGPPVDVLCNEQPHKTSHGTDSTISQRVNVIKDLTSKGQRNKWAERVSRNK
jgi:hypothetical protein